MTKQNLSTFQIGEPLTLFTERFASMPFIFHTEAFRSVFPNPFGISNLVLSVTNIVGITLKIFPLIISFFEG